MEKKSTSCFVWMIRIVVGTVLLLIVTALAASMFADYVLNSGNTSNSGNAIRTRMNRDGYPTDSITFAGNHLTAQAPLNDPDVAAYMNSYAGALALATVSFYEDNPNQSPPTVLYVDFTRNGTIIKKMSFGYGHANRMISGTLSMEQFWSGLDIDDAQ